jgi:hypothetical protein
MERCYWQDKGRYYQVSCFGEYGKPSENQLRTDRVGLTREGFDRLLNGLCPLCGKPVTVLPMIMEAQKADAKDFSYCWIRT